ncbi:glutamate 5-kinase [Thioalkalivibrio paradoxus]|uniref:Glutamate 5-kinase n=1 Tax=Thioalkalivibrio paradoxus ARh 1 TaxID=713585 RepID=W0DFD4_9GAMM|nr:glutamate 5-kinase [Thioalkalivibrio paradoxus]AHE97076.1 glutamate 5-kinase [Thioalkalivibrio paradoxus ARh 1]
MAAMRNGFPRVRRVVIKIGSALITGDGTGLDRAALTGWAREIAELRQQGYEVVLVSSGAVAEGMHRLGMRERPHALHLLQAAAAVGQMGLIRAYEREFSGHGLHAAQVLLTHDDLADRARYLNARSTIQALLGLGTIPVVNENDTVANDEIRLGDNDTLGALVANLLVADLLLILTDQHGLFDRDPRAHADARLIEEGKASDPALHGYVSSSFGRLGRGGMATKLLAAERAARSGTHTVIAFGRLPEVVARVVRGENIGTWLKPDREPLAARKRWIADQLHSRGELRLDAGAARVLRESGRSLLPVGVVDVQGGFRRGDVVTCMDPEGQPIARGLCNYGSDEVRRIRGLKADRVESVLGYVAEPELIHRDNLVLL